MSHGQENVSSGGLQENRIGRLRIALSEVNRVLLRSQTREDLLNRVCDLMVREGGYPIVWIGWLNPQTHVVVVAASAGEHAGKYLKAIKVTANGREEGQGPTGTAMREGITFVCNDFLADPRTHLWHEAARQVGIRSSAAFPFTCGKSIPCGTMNLYSGEVDAFQETDVALLEEISADVSYRLAQLEETEKVEKSKLQTGDREEMFRKFAEATSAVFWIMKAKPELILYVSPAFEAVWKVSASDLYRNPRLWMDSIHLDDRPRVMELFSNWINEIPGAEYDVEYRIVRPDGKMRWIHDRGFALFRENGERGSFAGIAEDVTDRKVAEEDLRSSRERYRNILDNMIEGCMVIGFDWTYLYVNEAAARHGYQERQNLIGRNMLSVYPGVEKSAVFARYKLCMDERIPQTFESSYTFADGTTNWYEFRVSPVPEGIFVLSLDITDRIRSERG